MKRLFDFQSFRGVFLCFLLVAWSALVVCAAAEEGADAEIASDDQHEQAWEALEEAGRKLEARVEPVMERLAAENDPFLLEQELLSLDAAMLPLALMQVHTMWGEDRAAGLREAISSSEVLYSSIADLLADDRPFMEFLVGRKEWQRLQAAGVETMLEEFGTMTLGAWILSPALATVSPDQAGKLLTALTTEPRYEHVKVPLAEMVGSGWMHELVELPEGWARERVEAGDTFWLPLLAAEDGVEDSSVLLEQMSGLPVEQQLRLVAQHPDPAFLPMLADFQQSFLDALECPDCQPEFGEPSQVEAHVMALASMGVPETIDMLHELIGIVPSAWQTDLATLAVHGLLEHDGRDARAGVMELLESDIEVPLSMWQIGRLENAGGERLRGVIEARIPGMVDKLLAASPEHGGDAWTWCETLPVLLFAHDRGWANAGPEIQGGLPDDEEFRQQLANCSWWFHSVAANSETGRGLRPLLDFWEQLPVETDDYAMLIGVALGAEGGDVEARRAVLFDWFSGRERWDELEPRVQDRLLGLPEPDSGSLNCEAPADWQPEAESTDEGES